MKIQLLVVGKTFQGFISEGLNDYLRRIGRYCSFEIVVIPDVKQAGKMTSDVLRKNEEMEILRRVKADSYLVLLDENGRMQSSREFAAFIDQNIQSRIKTLTFVIGGAFGFSQELKQRSNDSISLSKLTFSHQLARLVFAEQLYRAFTILRNEPYHND